MTTRIAMWSGPRNISTAMMRSWEARGDTYVVDEPLYAHYLSETGLDHPGAEEVMAVHETDWEKVVASLRADPPSPFTICYQKHMAHHLLPHIDRQWIGDMTNCFLIRDPGEMIPSLAQHLDQPTLADTGLPQQLELFEELAAQGKPPPVIDARDVLLDPGGMLRALCREIGIPYRSTMLQWSVGRRLTDGVWAKYWYEQVEQSTGFRTYRPSQRTIPATAQALYDACLEPYRRLFSHRISPEASSAA